ncbi:kinase [Klebsiella pneumoniae]|uniref:Kinase n=1 Tax=Klebsiella pneumoniae TaxID=573 RepID=A0A377TJA5_KLEPN|nr:kinase [Klebsiella pneumoniae]
MDVKYINPVTWAEETVQCRTPENPFPRKTESYTIDVAMTADRAWRIGMRRLMKYLHQRRTYTATTSMLGWCHDFGDHIILSDDIPTGKTQSCLIDAMIYDFQEITLHVTEPLDWSYANPRCWIQFQDGRPSSRMLTPQRVDDFTLTVPYNDDLHPDDWIMDDPDIDPPKLLFCDSEKGARHGIVQEVAPSGDSNCQITAPEYKEIFYQYDDATYPATSLNTKKSLSTFLSLKPSFGRTPFLEQKTWPLTRSWGARLPLWLLDNAERLDKLVNGPAAAVPDRGGDSLKSWRLQQQEIANTLVNFQENGGAMGFSSLQELLAFTPDKANVLAVDTSTGEQYLWNGTEWVPSEYQVNSQIKSLNEIVEKSHSTKFFHRWKDRIGTIIAGWKNDDVGGVYFCHVC